MIMSGLERAPSYSQDSPFVSDWREAGQIGQKCFVDLGTSNTTSLSVASVCGISLDALPMILGHSIRCALCRLEVMSEMRHC